MWNEVYDSVKSYDRMNRNEMVIKFFTTAVTLSVVPSIVLYSPIIAGFMLTDRE
jgi:hypothetical protein